MRFPLDGLAKKHLVIFSFDSNTEAVKQRPWCMCVVTELLASLMNKSLPRGVDNVKSLLHTEQSAIMC